jgi:hypothetical protein
MTAIPSDAELEAEREREERSERWLFAREVMIALVLIGLIVAHALLS